MLLFWVMILLSNLQVRRWMNCGSEVGLSRWLFLNVPIFVLYVCHDNGYFYDDDDYVNDMKKKKKKKPFFTSLRWMLWWLWWWQQRWYVEQNVVWLLSWMLFYLTEFRVTCGNSFGKSNEILGIFLFFVLFNWHFSFFLWQVELITEHDSC